MILLLRNSHLKFHTFVNIWVTIGYGIFSINVKFDSFCCLKHLGQHFHFWWNVKYGVWYKCLQETLFTSLQTIILTLYIPRQSMQKRKKWYGADRKSIMRRDSENCMILMASKKWSKKVVVYQTLNFRCILYTDVLMGQQISSFSMRIL